MDKLLDIDSLQFWFFQTQIWFLDHVLVISTLVQLGVIALAGLVASTVAKRFGRYIQRLIEKHHLTGGFRTIAETITIFPLPVVWLALLWLTSIAAAYTPWPYELIEIAASLLSLWILIRMITSLVRHPILSKALAFTVFAILALNLVDLLDPTIALLDAAAFKIGDMRFSALTVIKGVLALFLLLWAAIEFSSMLERRIHRLPNLAPSVQVLLGKLLKIVLIAVAIMATLSYVGIDLTAFAVFSGAVGVGIGFGLQKVVSNLISGFILLLDKSIKPGDLIEVGNTMGYISSLGARYVSIDTRTGREILIPNEEMITQRVVNLSYSNWLIQIEAPVGIAYGEDIRRAMAICIEAAEATQRILKRPAPSCVLHAFGDRSINLIVSFWIADPQNGLANVKSDLLLAIWDRFRAADISVPFAAAETLPDQGLAAASPTKD